MKLSYGIPFVLLAGCSSHVFYYQDDAALATLEADLDACKAEALDAAPVNIVEQDFELTFVTGHKAPRFFVPTGLEYRDDNLGRRSRLERMCMAEKGYERIEFDRCEAGIEPASPSQTILPKAENVQCYARVPGSRIVFVET